MEWFGCFFSILGNNHDESIFDFGSFALLSSFSSSTSFFFSFSKRIPVDLRKKRISLDVMILFCPHSVPLGSLQSFFHNWLLMREAWESFFFFTWRRREGKGKFSFFSTERFPYLVRTKKQTAAKQTIERGCLPPRFGELYWWILQKLSSFGNLMLSGNRKERED